MESNGGFELRTKQASIMKEEKQQKTDEIKGYPMSQHMDELDIDQSNKTLAQGTSWYWVCIIMW